MPIENIIPIIWVVFAGVCCAAFYAFYQKRIVGDLLRAFTAAGADSPENAKTLSDIGYGTGIKARFARRALKKGSVLRKSIEAIGETVPQEKNRHPDEFFVKKETLSDSVRFYVPEDKRRIAERRYDGDGMTASALLLTVVSFFAAAVLLIAFLPQILSLLKNFGKTPAQNVSEKPSVSAEDTVFPEEKNPSESSEENTDENSGENLSENSENPGESSEENSDKNSMENPDGKKEKSETDRSPERRDGEDQTERLTEKNNEK